MKNILHVCPWERDVRELSLLNNNEYNIIFDEISRNLDPLIDFSNTK